MDPLSLSLAGMGVSILGNLFSGVMGLFGGDQQDKIAKADARQARQEASVNSEQAFQEGNTRAASAATQAAANGGGFGGGASALGLVQQDANMAMFNARTQIYRGETQARADLYQGQVAKQNGIDQLIGGVVGAGSSAFGTYANNQFRQSILNNRTSYSDPYALAGLGF